MLPWSCREVVGVEHTFLNIVIENINKSLANGPINPYIPILVVVMFNLALSTPSSTF